MVRVVTKICGEVVGVGQCAKKSDCTVMYVVVGDCGAGGSGVWWCPRQEGLCAWRSTLCGSVCRLLALGSPFIDECANFVKESMRFISSSCGGCDVPVSDEAHGLTYWG